MWGKRPCRSKHGLRSSLQFGKAVNTLSLLLCHLVTPALGRQASAAQQTGRESQIKKEVSQGGRHRSFCSKMCLVLSVCSATDVPAFPRSGFIWSLQTLPKCNLRIKGLLPTISKCLAIWQELPLVVCSVCVHESYSWGVLCLTRTSFTMLAEHVPCSEWEPGHGVLPQGVWLQ